MRYNLFGLLLLGCLSSGAPAFGRQVAATEADGRCDVPAALELVIETAESVASATAKSGDKFKIRLAEPAIVDGRTLIPAGTGGIGEVIHAARSKAWGQSGELILAARYLDVGGSQVPLRAFRLNATGRQGRIDTYITGGGVARVLVGSNTEAPAGSTGIARVAEATSVPCVGQISQTP